jgi:hypothetical protein
MTFELLKIPSPEHMWLLASFLLTQIDTNIRLDTHKRWLVGINRRILFFLSTFQH